MSNDSVFANSSTTNKQEQIIKFVVVVACFHIVALAGNQNENTKVDCYCKEVT